MIIVDKQADITNNNFIPIKNKIPNLIKQQIKTNKNITTHKYIP
jgi:hypothetical protein